MQKHRYYIGLGRKGKFYTLRETFDEMVTPTDVRKRDSYVRTLSIKPERAVEIARQVTGLTLSLPEESTTKISRRKDIDWSVLQFGKYAGRSIHEIRKSDPDYLVWIARNMSSPKNEKTLAKIRDIFKSEINSQEKAEKAEIEAREKAQAIISEINRPVIEVMKENAENSNFCADMAETLKTSPISDLSYICQDIISDIYAKSFGRRGSKAYKKAEENFEKLTEKYNEKKTL